MLAWFGALPASVKVQGRRVHLAAPAVLDRESEQSNGVILGLLKFSLASCYDHLLELSAGEREQYNFWNRQCPRLDSIEGHLIVCEVQHFSKLPQAVPVQQCTDTRPHGLITEMEQGQPERLLSEHGQLLQAVFRAAPPCTLVRLPPSFAQKVADGSWKRFLLPNFNPLVSVTKYAWYCNWSRLGLSQAALPAPRFQFLAQPEQPQQDFAHLDLGVLRSIADHLRSLGYHLLENGEHEMVADVHRDLCRLQILLDDLDPAAVQSRIRTVSSGHLVQGPVHRTSPYRAAFVIEVLMQCDLLVSDASLQDSVKQALKLILPRSLLPMFLQMVEQHGFPGRSQISRWRLLLDAAFMLQVRAERRLHWQQGQRFVRWMMVDSSPQGGRDYELIVMSRALVADLPHALSLLEIMHNMCLDRENCDPEEFQAEQERLQCEIRHMLALERPPPVVLGSGRTSLPDKFAATAHALYLETGSITDLALLAEEVASCTSDLGTEFNIVRVAGARPLELLPWLQTEHAQHEDEWPEEEQLLKFGNALAVPGILHILHNAAKRMLGGLPELSGAVDSLANVADLLRKKHTQQRLCERCFSSPVGQQLRPQIQAFQGKVHPARWGTIAFCTQQILQIERPLRWGWSLAMYLGPSSDQASELTVKASAVSDALTSEHWWQCLKVLDKLHKAIRHLFAWCEGCPCHGVACPEGPDPNNRNFNRQWEHLKESCPLRGRRCAELACGDFLEELRSQLDVSAAEVVLGMAPSLSPEQQATLVSEFECGRASLLFNIALKVSPMHREPLLVFGIAHLDLRKARDALAQCLASDNTEGLLAELKSGAVLAEANDFLAGENLSELPLFSAFVGKLRFAFSVERGIEGEHASIHHFIRKAPCHTVAYVSLKRRLPEFKQRLKDPVFFEKLSVTLDKIRNPKLVVDALGLSQHSGCQDLAHPWDTTYGKIVYRSDPLTTQRATAAINVRPLPNVGPRRAQPAKAIADAAGAGAPSSPAGSYMSQVLHDAALVHFSTRLAEECAKGERAFSVRVSEDSLRALLDLPAVSSASATDPITASAQPALVDRAADRAPEHGDPDQSQLAASSGGSSVETVFSKAFMTLSTDNAPNSPKAFAFKVVSLNPAQGKLPLQAFEQSDVGVSVLRTVRVDFDQRKWLVDSTPLRVRTSSPSASEVRPNDERPSIPLVFSPSSIPLEALLQIYAWEIHPDSGLNFHGSPVTESGNGSGDGDTATNLSQCAEMSDLLARLQCAGDHGVSFTSDMSDTAKACLEFLRTHQLVQAVPGSRRHWSFAPDAKDHLCVTRTLVKPMAIMKVRDVPYTEMNLYELYKSLEDKGFQCCVCSRSERKEIKKTRYVAGDADKLWYMEAGKAPSRNYLISLLLAESHGEPVPALACSAVAQRILVDHGLVEKKPAPKPSQKRLALLDCAIAEDDWEVPAPAPKRVARKPKAKPKPQADVMPAVEDCDAALQDAEAAVASPIAPTSESGTDTEEEKPPHTAPVKPTAGVAQPSAEPSVGKASSSAGSSTGCSSSSSSSSGSSSRSQSSSSSSSAPVAPKPKRRKTPIFDKKKDMSRSVATVHCRLTPRFQKDTGAITGYQMTCLHPQHEDCNKSLSISVAGCEDLTIRMLKAWIVQGQVATSKQEHKNLWPEILAARKSKAVPSLRDLDKKIAQIGHLSASASSRPGAAADPSAPQTRVRSKRALPGSAAVSQDQRPAKASHTVTTSGAAPVTPPAVRERMEALIASGAIPKTTEAQRRRNKRTANTTYGTPPGLTEALDFGYVHPNLPPPRGMQWVKSGHKEFSLTYKGG